MHLWACHCLAASAPQLQHGHNKTSHKRLYAEDHMESLPCYDWYVGSAQSSISWYIPSPVSCQAISWRWFEKQGATWIPWSMLQLLWDRDCVREWKVLFCCIVVSKDYFFNLLIFFKQAFAWPLVSSLFNVQFVSLWDMLLCNVLYLCARGVSLGFHSVTVSGSRSVCPRHLRCNPSQLRASTTHSSPCSSGGIRRLVHLCALA